LLLVGILSAIASLFDLVQIITALILARILIMFVGQIIGLLLLRKRHPETPRPFRMWLYPLPALFAMACWLYIFLVQAFEPEGWKYMLYVLAVFVTGVSGFLILARRQRYWPFAS
jgi:amino acid transporter